MLKEHPWYNYDKIQSYNGTYNFIIGGRGRGKTYGAKKKVIADAIKKGDEFIYLRRYKTELQAARPSFFGDVYVEFPEFDFRAKGTVAQMSHIKHRGEKHRLWKTIGYFIALSNVQTQKSVVFDKVKTIIFDEFIIEVGGLRYLPSEEIVFNNFYSTVDRYKDKTKAFFLANAVSIMNPYFLAYDLRIDSEVKDTFIKVSKGFIVIHIDSSDAFNESVLDTRYGRFIKGTDYAQYAVANQFADNKDTLIEFKGHKARYIYTLETENGTFSLWWDAFNDTYYAQSKRPKKQIKYTLVPEWMDEDKVLMIHSDILLMHLRTAYRKARIYFDKPSTRNAFIDVFKR